MRIGLIDSGLGGLYYLKYNNIKSPFLFMDKAYFPYGNKTKEFLIKRTIYIIEYMKLNNINKIILACNTLSIITLPFIKLLYDNVYGVFDLLLPYINNKSLIIGSKRTINELKYIYKYNDYYDGSKLIYLIENKLDYKYIINHINTISKNNSNIILCCTHFITIPNTLFLIPCIKNKT